MTDPLAQHLTRLAVGLPADLRAVARERLTRWAAANDVRPYTGHARCLARLATPRHRCGRARPAWPRVLDHPEWWVRPDGSLIVTAHPYGHPGEPATLTDDQRRELAAVAARLGVEYEVDAAGSWYYPDWTVLVVLRGKAPDPPRPRYERAFPRLGIGATVAAARRDGYVVAGRGLARAAALWHRECAAAGRPFVRILPRRTWAAVELSMETAGRRLVGPLRARVAALARGHSRDYVAHGPEHCYIRSVPVDRARAVAEALRDLSRPAASLIAYDDLSPEHAGRFEGWCKDAGHAPSERLLAAWLGLQEVIDAI